MSDSTFKEKLQKAKSFQDAEDLFVEEGLFDCTIVTEMIFRKYMDSFHTLIKEFSDTKKKAASFLESYGYDIDQLVWANKAMGWLDAYDTNQKPNTASTSKDKYPLPYTPMVDSNCQPFSSELWIMIQHDKAMDMDGDISNVPLMMIDKAMEPSPDSLPWDDDATEQLHAFIESLTCMEETIRAIIKCLYMLNRHLEKPLNREDFRALLSNLTLN